MECEGGIYTDPFGVREDELRYGFNHRIRQYCSRHEGEIIDIAKWVVFWASITLLTGGTRTVAVYT